MSNRHTITHTPDHFWDLRHCAACRREAYAGLAFWLLVALVAVIGCLS